jgi:hypothetical protein
MYTAAAENPCTAGKSRRNHSIPLFMKGGLGKI